jgi:hypothetical protein
MPRQQTPPRTSASLLHCTTPTTHPALALRSGTADSGPRPRVFACTRALLFEHPVGSVPWPPP